MSNNLHVVPFELKKGQHFDKTTNTLTLDKAGSFTITIKEYLKELETLEKNISYKYEQIYNEKIKEKKTPITKEIEELNLQRSKLFEKYKDTLWAWQLVGDELSSELTHNNSFAKGISGFSTDVNGIKKFRTVSFSKLIEGGGRALLEAFSDSDPATASSGLYVKATGSPKIITAEWKDKDNNKITEEVAFGSTVYLHLYTEALYKQELKIGLRDTKYKNSDLTPTPSDENGNPIVSLKDKTIKHFHREVGVHQYTTDDPLTIPPKTAITNTLIKDKSSTKLYVQKCVFPVFIEHAWQFQGAGNNADFKDWNSMDSGKKLEINPIIFHENLEDGLTELDITLKVSKNDGKLIEGELTGNKPFLIGENESELENSRDDKILKDFTFGVFIDGTMNNKYNTTARINWEKKRLNENDTTYNEEDHLKVYAKKWQEVKDKKFNYRGDEYQYRYGNVSYENELSNPAILFQNYSDKDIDIHKIYTEGMGTNTLADEQEKVAKYKTDDAFLGSGLGIGNAGIIDRVTRAVEQMAEKIKIDKTKEKINTITVDVFGFSRGSAAARHFIYEITSLPYHAKQSGWDTIYYTDHSDRKVNIDSSEGFMLPSNGYLGYLLTQKGITFNRLMLRFAGLYDTVAHHGYFQYNDIKDLGLDSISKAKTVIHMTAGDEHRYNFSLSRINRKNNHIELNLPGVHCDVGGSYIEGRPEGNAPNTTPDPAGEHIIAEGVVSRSSTSNPEAGLKLFREKLIEEGWYKDNQIYLKGESNFFKTKYTYSLISHRAYVSNQYSFIPLQMMCNYGVKNNLPFDNSSLLKSHKFNNNSIFKDNVLFLNKIKGFLEAYAQQVEENPTKELHYTIPKEDLMQLRNHYLHYNAVVGLVNKPEPHRKRGEIQP